MRVHPRELRQLEEHKIRKHLMAERAAGLHPNRDQAWINETAYRKACERVREKIARDTRD